MLSSPGFCFKEADLFSKCLFLPLVGILFYLHVVLCGLKATSFHDSIAYENEGKKVELTLSQTTNFRLFQTERVCRRQF